VLAWPSLPPLTWIQMCPCQQTSTRLHSARFQRTVFFIVLSPLLPSCLLGCVPCNLTNVTCTLGEPSRTIIFYLKDRSIKFLQNAGDTFLPGTCSSVVVKALCYKLEDRPNEVNFLIHLTFGCYGRVFSLVI
jgi:hypothetical protein